MVTQRAAEDLGPRIARVASEAGVSAQKLAAEANIAYATLLRRLAGDGKLTVVELERISRSLDVDPASWFEVAA